MFRIALKMFFAVACIAIPGATPATAQYVPRPWEPGFVQPLTPTQPAAMPPVTGISPFASKFQTERADFYRRFEPAFSAPPAMDTAALPRSRAIVLRWAKSFPCLGEDFEVVEPETRDCNVCAESCYQRDAKTGAYIANPGMCIPGTYNCIAYTTDITNIWVSPFPSLEGWDKYYERPGYVRMRAVNTDHEAGFQKVAVFAKFTPEGKFKEFTHAARENDNGTWTSKLGSGPLVRHRSAESVSGPSYGEVVLVYVRKK
jgi:hypothetical protein